MKKVNSKWWLGSFGIVIGFVIGLVSSGGELGIGLINGFGYGFFLFTLGWFFDTENPPKWAEVLWLNFLRVAMFLAYATTAVLFIMVIYLLGRAALEYLDAHIIIIR